LSDTSTGSVQALWRSGTVRAKAQFR